MHILFKHVSLAALITTAALPHPSGAQDGAADAAEAAAEAIAAAEMASLVGTAEGLYRGCKASVELRKGRPSEDNLRIAFELAERCESYARGVAHAINSATPYTLGMTKCRVDGVMEPRRVIDAIVATVQNDPVQIGQRTTDQTLTYQALKSISTCDNNSR